MSNEHKDHRKVNTDDLENFIFDGDRRKKERYFAFLFILFGAIGLYFVINGSQEKENNAFRPDAIYNTQSSVQPNPSDESTDAPNPNLAESKKPKESAARLKHLAIDGHMEAKDPVYFTINSFNEAATYTLHFNNGKTKEVSQKTVEHIFDKPGNYNATLNITYKGQTKVIAKEAFKIMEAIAIAPNANQYDFQ